MLLYQVKTQADSVTSAVCMIGSVYQNKTRNADSHSTLVTLILSVQMTGRCGIEIGAAVCCREPCTLCAQVALSKHR